MADKTAVSIVIRFNEEEIHVTEEAVIDTHLANQIRELLTTQANGLIETLTKAQNL